MPCPPFLLFFPNHASPTVMGKVSVDDAIGRFSHDKYYLSISDNNILKISTLSFSVRSLVEVVPAVDKNSKIDAGKPFNRQSRSEVYLLRVF